METLKIIQCKSITKECWIKLKLVLNSNLNKLYKKQILHISLNELQNIKAKTTKFNLENWTRQKSNSCPSLSYHSPGKQVHHCLPDMILNSRFSKSVLPISYNSRFLFCFLEQRSSRLLYIGNLDAISSIITLLKSN